MFKNLINRLFKNRSELDQRTEEDRRTVADMDERIKKLNQQCDENDRLFEEVMGKS